VRPPWEEFERRSQIKLQKSHHRLELEALQRSEAGCTSMTIRCHAYDGITGKIIEGTALCWSRRHCIVLGREAPERTPQVTNHPETTP
jgi:hypothetical protein